MKSIHALPTLPVLVLLRLPVQAMDEEWYTATYTYASPLLRGMKIMRRNHHSDGACRVVSLPPDSTLPLRWCERGLARIVLSYA
jgi:hypothetical protein